MQGYAPQFPPMYMSGVPPHGYTHFPQGYMHPQRAEAAPHADATSPAQELPVYGPLPIPVPYPLKKPVFPSHRAGSAPGSAPGSPIGSPTPTTCDTLDPPTPGAPRKPPPRSRRREVEAVESPHSGHGSEGSVGLRGPAGEPPVKRRRRAVPRYPVEAAGGAPAEEAVDVDAINAASALAVLGVAPLHTEEAAPVPTVPCPAPEPGPWKPCMRETPMSKAIVEATWGDHMTGMTCPVSSCTTICTGPSRLQDHIARRHLEERGYRCSHCCGFTIIAVSATSQAIHRMRSHECIMHADPRIRVCTHKHAGASRPCGRMFDSSADLQGHTREEHGSC